MTKHTIIKEYVIPPISNFTKIINSSLEVNKKFKFIKIDTVNEILKFQYEFDSIINYKYGKSEYILTEGKKSIFNEYKFTNNKVIISNFKIYKGNLNIKFKFKEDSTYNKNINLTSEFYVDSIKFLSSK